MEDAYRALRSNRLMRFAADRHVPVAPLVAIVVVAVLTPVALLVGSQLRPATKAHEAIPVAQAPDIRSIDFGALTYPGAVFACFQAAGGAAPAPTTVRLHNGAATDSASGASLALKSVLYGDVNGDGSDEAIVRLNCTAGADLFDDSVAVYTSSVGGPRLLASVPTPGPELVGDFEPRVLAMASITNGVDVVWERWEAGEPHCCSTSEVDVHYQWNGATLDKIGDVQVRPQRAV